MAQYVYGIVEAGSTAPRARGIADAPLRIVAGEDASALVSEIQADRVNLGREEVLVHARVLERALGRGPVLPMRFGIVMDDAEEIRSRLLDEHGPDLRAQLADMEGKVEIRIRASYDQASLLRDVVREHPEIASLSAAVKTRSEDAGYYDRIRLGEAIAAAIERHRDRDAQAILEALAAHALAVEPAESSHERVVVQASFLVARDHLADFNAAVDHVADGYGGQIRFKYTGPLPPHSFVELAGAA